MKTTIMEYENLVLNKKPITNNVGFDANELNPKLLDFQDRIVRWALRLGRAAVFADCGMGKTLMQLVIAEACAMQTGKPSLILTPLMVAPQTVKEAAKFGIDGVAFAQTSAQIPAGTPVVVANYERVKEFDPPMFGCVCLDESSILKSFSGTTKRLLIETFNETPYRFCFTATPAPNDHTELGNHSEFLGVMDSHQMLARWFINDTMQAGNYRLKGHGESDFWEWVCGWAVSIRKPSDVGGSDVGFDMPEIEFIERRVVADHDQSDGKLFSSGTPSAAEIAKVARQTLDARVAEAAQIVAENPGVPIAIWCNLNEESSACLAAIDGAVEVRGDQKDATKEGNIRAFQDGAARVMVTKPKMCGFGLNWQHCHICIFLGLSYSYEAMYQAVRRHHRFGQKNAVKAYIVTSDIEDGVLRRVQEKQEAHETMSAAMVENTRKFVLGGSCHADASPFGEFAEISGNGWRIVNGDCVKGVSREMDNSVGYTIFSPPFANLYIYSSSLADMGNCESDVEYYRQFGFLAKELLRVTKPGRLCSIHCKDLPMYMNRDGASGLRDFPGETVRVMQECGWVFHSRVTIWKDPVIEMQRTKSHGLLHKQVCMDSTFSRQGMADYLLTFRKWEEGELDPVTRGEDVRFGGAEYYGDDVPTAFKDQPGYARTISIRTWQRYASPVWMDIRQTEVLNPRKGTGAEDEKHICPLQLDVIDRGIELWSNPGDLVLSPFTGIGSEGYCAVKAGRRFLGFELKESYFRQAALNIKNAEASQLELAL